MRLALVLLLAVVLLTPEIDSRRFWLTPGQLGRELALAQVHVVKDEDAPADDACRADGSDARFSDRRYLMCAGSILTGRHVLTSASCIHEATHIRHNVRAPLAVLVSAFSNTAQVIRVSEFHLHPRHVFDPRDKNHALHNVAVIKLACRIFTDNLNYRIELPDAPFADGCADESCFVGIVRRIDQSAYIMYETRAGSVEYERNVITRMEKQAKQQSTGVSSTAQKSYYESDVKSGVPKINVVMDGSTGDNNKNTSLSAKNSLERQDQGDREKKVRPRSSHAGPSGCPHTGSPVMHNRTQYGLVASSCDERQPEVPWRFTDLLENLDWINSITNYRPNNQLCGSCVYNFYVECKEPGECRKSASTVCGVEGLRIPGLELPSCPAKQTTSISLGESPVPDKKPDEPPVPDKKPDEPAPEEESEVGFRMIDVPSATTESVPETIQQEPEEVPNPVPIEVPGLETTTTTESSITSSTIDNLQLIRRRLAELAYSAYLSKLGSLYETYVQQQQQEQQRQNVTSGNTIVKRYDDPAAARSL